MEFSCFFRASDWSSEVVGYVGEVCRYNQTLDYYGVEGHYRRVVNCLDHRYRIPVKVDGEFCLHNEPKPPERESTFVECCNKRLLVVL